MIDSKAFRRSLSKFATGVTIVTCTDDAGNPYGITANSFSSVSLEPSLILWNIAKVSNSLGAFLAAEHFVINILTAKQEALSTHFAKSDHTRFDSIEVDRSVNNVPLIRDSLACFECRTEAIHDCGDHHIIIGEVIEFRSRDEIPLLFFAGNYASLA